MGKTSFGVKNQEFCSEMPARSMSGWRCGLGRGGEGWRNELGTGQQFMVRATRPDAVNRRASAARVELEWGTGLEVGPAQDVGGQLSSLRMN